MIFSYSESRTGYCIWPYTKAYGLVSLPSQLGKLLLDNQRIKLLVFDRRAEVIMRWIP